MYARRGLLTVLLGGFLLVVTGGLSWAGTIESGQTRTVMGTIAAVDVAYRSVVLEVPRPKGDLTVGVTLAPGVEAQVKNAPLPLSQVAVGEQAELRYTRKDGQLIGLRLVVRR